MVQSCDIRGNAYAIKLITLVACRNQIAEGRQQGNLNAPGLIFLEQRRVLYFDWMELSEYTF